jgi:hypothetical protein
MASFVPSGDRARPVTPVPCGCTVMGSGVSCARALGTGLAGSMRSRKKPVGGAWVSGGEASSWAARTKVRSSAAAATPMKVP